MKADTIYKYTGEISIKENDDEGWYCVDVVIEYTVSVDDWGRSVCIESVEGELSGKRLLELVGEDEELEERLLVNADGYEWNYVEYGG